MPSPKQNSKALLQEYQKQKKDLKKMSLTPSKPKKKFISEYSQRQPTNVKTTERKRSAMKVNNELR